MKIQERGPLVATKTVPAVATDIDVEVGLAFVEKAQQLAGHFPDAEDMDRARRILTGELSPEAARAEVRESLARIVEEERAATHGR